MLAVSYPAIPSIGLLALTGGVLWVALRGPLKMLAATLFFALLLVPEHVHSPFFPENLSYLRFSLYAVLFSIVLRIAKGEISADALRPQRVHIATFAFVAAAWVLGVVPDRAGGLPIQDFAQWRVLVDQALFLVAATAVIRLCGLRWSCGLVAAMVTLSAAIGIAERTIGLNYASVWLEHTKYASFANQVYERGGSARVKGPGDFALQYGWVLAAFLPLVAVMALRTKRVIALAAPAIVAVTVVLTVSRSPYAGMAAGGLVLLLTVKGDRRVVLAVVAAGLVAGVFFLFTSVIRHPFDEAANTDSVSSRTRRFQVVGELASDHPIEGLGLSALAVNGIESTDSSYVALYAEIGVVGVSFLGVAFLTATGTAFAASRLAPGSAGRIGAAATAGLVACMMAPGAFDSLTQPFSGWTVWLLAAVGAVALERAPERDPAQRIRPHPARVLLPVAGAGIGFVIAALAPVHVAQTVEFSTLSVGFVNGPTGGNDFVGRARVLPICDLTKAALRGSDIHVDCRDAVVDGPGVGLARFEAPSGDRVRDALAELDRWGSTVSPAYRRDTLSGPTKGKATVLWTAPVPLGIAGLALALLFPPWRWPRHEEDGEASALGPLGVQVPALQRDA